MALAVKTKFNLGQNHLKIQLCYADIISQGRLSMYYAVAECTKSWVRFQYQRLKQTRELHFRGYRPQKAHNNSIYIFASLYSLILHTVN